MFSKNYWWMACSSSAMMNRSTIFCTLSTRSRWCSFCTCPYRWSWWVLLKLHLLQLLLYDLLLLSCTSHWSWCFATIKCSCMLLLNLWFFELFLIFRCLTFRSRVRHWARKRCFASFGRKKYFWSIYESWVLTQSCKLIVKVVTIEECLNRISSQH
jgi:hypothetical protein